MGLGSVARSVGLQPCMACVGLLVALAGARVAIPRSGGSPAGRPWSASLPRLPHAYRDARGRRGDAGAVMNAGSDVRRPVGMLGSTAGARTSVLCDYRPRATAGVPLSSVG
jgi:hypothetical protein